MRLEGRVAIVTGAAHGIGRAIAGALAEQGAAVLIADIDEPAGEDAAAEIRKLGHAASFARVDVSGVGSEIEHLPLFPDRTNVEFVVVDASEATGFAITRAKRQRGALRPPR